MIEKKLVQILEPIIDQVVDLAKRIDRLQLQPGPAGEPGKDGRDGRDADPAEVASLIKADVAYAAALKGEEGSPGRDGADGKDADPEAVADALKADPDFVARNKGEPGEKGEKGDTGKPGRDADPSAVAAALKADEEFVAGLKGDRGEQGPVGEKGEPGERGADGADGAPADPDDVAKALMGNDTFVKSVMQLLEAHQWVPGIYREGKCVSAYNGRLYQAACDTTDEPGDSPQWKRLGTGGWRDVGGYDEKRVYEAGDVYHKDGATFYFDGKNHRLWLARPFTERDYEKHVKGERAASRETLKALIESNKELRALADGQQAEIESLKQLVADLAEQIAKVKK